MMEEDDDEDEDKGEEDKNSPYQPHPFQIEGLPDAAPDCRQPFARLRRSIRVIPIVPNTIARSAQILRIAASMPSTIWKPSQLQ